MEVISSIDDVFHYHSSSPTQQKDHLERVSSSTNTHTHTYAHTHAQDATFFSYLEDIERNYFTLHSKQDRIRVQKWVEKLVTSVSVGSTNTNPAWRAHRDAYAKLLASMLSSKKKNLRKSVRIFRMRYALALNYN